MKKLLYLVFFVTIASFSQDLLTLNSHFTPKTDSVYVFKPTNYSSQETYPLLILLHGWSGNFRQWNEITDLQELADSYNFVIACPDGFYDSWYIDSPIRKDYKMNSFITQFLMPHLTNNYSINSKEVFISGLSMGGFGAIYTFLKNPALFRSAAASSGVLNLLTFAENWGMKNSIGSIKDNYQDYVNVNTMSILDTISVFEKEFLIDCGTNDRIHITNDEFYKKCLSKKIPLTFISQPGRHDKAYWAKSIIFHLNFFREILNR